MIRFRVAVALLSLLALTCTDSTNPLDDGETADCTWTVGTMGAFTGDFAASAESIFQGVEYAIDTANEQGGLACRLELIQEDSQGDPNEAAALARQMVGDRTLVFCACPYLSSETLTVGPEFSDAGIAISGIGTADSISGSGLSTWFRAVASDATLAEVTGTYLREGLEATRVVTIHDDQAYSKGQVEGVVAALGDTAGETFTIDPAAGDYSDVVEQVQTANPDAIFYGGYAPQAGLLASQLQAGGVRALFMSDYAAKEPPFASAAGRAATGALVSCPCADPAKLELGVEFEEGMKSAYGRAAPGPFAAEMFDVTNLVIDALREYEGDPADVQAVRGHVVEAFRTAEDYQGISKSYSWDDSGEFEGGPDDVWIYEWRDGASDFVSLGRASDLI
jgi:branched-chain amino acid transport system substrate-binding protein